MLEGSLVSLKQIEEEDLQTLRGFRNLPHIRAYTREYRPLNMLNQKAWWESLLTDKSNIMFAIKTPEEKHPIGCCGLTNINWKEGNAEVSIYIGNEEWQGKGHASESLQLLLKYGFCELRLHRIYAIIYAYNGKSEKFFRKNGFLFEGYHREARFFDGGYHNELVYGILNREYSTIPEIPNNH